MSKIPTSTTGEPYQEYVKDQIKLRQKIYAAGFGDKNRTAEELAYLTTRTAWVKCASSVIVSEGDGTDRLNKIFEGTSITEDQVAGLLGDDLAKRYVLFNGISDYNNPESIRGGYSKTSNPLTEALYGFGGLEFGQRPMPGITSFNIGHNNIGSLRTGELVIEANNRVQFNIIEALYVRLGFTIFLEWGFSSYFKETEQKDGGKTSVERTYVSTGAETQTLIDDGTWFDQRVDNKEEGATETTGWDLAFLEKIEQKRKEFAGNYDAFFGKVVNFQWTFTPQGTYQITLTLRSVGDVVESFKVNNLSSKYALGRSTNDGQSNNVSEADKSDLLNVLYCARTSKDLFTNTDDPNFVSIDYASLSVEAGSASRGVKGGNLFETSFKNTKTRHYIKLNKFLQELELLLPHKSIKGSDKREPMLKISTDLDNYMRLFPGLNSTNPNVCIIRNDTQIELSKGVKIGDNEVNNSQFSNFEIASLEPEKGSLLGRIMNIYLSVDFLETKVKDLVNKSDKNEVTVFSFLQSLTRDLNSCFGGYIDLQPTIKDGSSLIIKDLNLKARIESDGATKEATQEDKDGIIKVFGFDNRNGNSNAEGSFIKELNIASTISPQLAADISIAAAASNRSTSTTNSFFKNFNSGLSDRYQDTVYDNSGDPQGSTEEESTSNTSIVGDCKTGRSTSKTPPTFDDVQASVDVLTESRTSNTVSSEEKNRENLELAETTFVESKIAYFEYLRDCFGVTNQQENIPLKYFRGTKDDIERGAATLRKYISSRVKVIESKAKVEGKEHSDTGLGFIPINISLTLEGISGIKIYNQLSIDSRFLPIKYPDVAEFVIVKVGHALSKNDWITQIEALIKPYTKDSGELESGVDSLGSDATEALGTNTDLDIADDLDGVTFFPPLATLPPFNIRNDDAGGGAFGASRGDSGTHRGVDLPTVVSPANDIDLFKEYPYLYGNAKRAGINPTTDTVNSTLASIVTKPPLYTGKGTAVFAPITGKVVPSFAKDYSVLPGVKIIGNGEYKGYIVKIFYVAYEKSIMGKNISKGDFIGTAVQVDLQPQYKGATNHIHYAVQRGPVSINPENVNYSLDK